MITKYCIDGEALDSLDLKALIVTRGIKVSGEVYKRFGETNRIYPDPLKCNCLILPDETVVQMTDLALHLKYVRSMISFQNLRMIGQFSQMNTPFKLEVSGSGKPIITHNEELVTEVRLPQPTHFYDQKTSSGLPYTGNAVLQGVDVLSFQCLWACEYARAGYPCQFCYSGGVFQDLARRNKPNPPVPTPQDVAEITNYAVKTENFAKYLQITGGSTMNPQAECGVIKSYLDEVKNSVGFGNIKGEILVYTTPPADPKQVDQILWSGADRIACSMEVWDESLAQIITPGKIKFAGRQRFLDTLRYVAKEYGPNKACSSFVVGVEPIDNFLKGAETLASEGIVPIASLWIPFGRPVMGGVKAPGLADYRKVKKELADIYARYGIQPPGGIGFNVCLCKDCWNHKEEIIAGQCC